MTRPLPEFDELRGLLDALCEETITPEQLGRLEELLLASPEAEAYYVQYLSLFSELGRHFAVLPARAEQSLRDRVGTGQPPEQPKQPARARTSRSFPVSGKRLLWGALLSGLAAALILYLMPRQPPVFPPIPPPIVEHSDDTVAVLVHAPGAVWEKARATLQAGAPLSPGWLRLKSGFAQIEFYNGAMVILHGPAELLLISRQEAYCARGKLRALVPPQAQGFKIRSPRLDLVDRGTEFGLDVGAGDNTEVHVFQGKVELHNPREAPPAGHKELTTGQSVQVAAGGDVNTIKIKPDAFLTAQQLAKRSEEETVRWQRKWRKTSDALRRDPGLVVYYPFEAAQPWSRTLTDQAAGRRQPHDGAIVGGLWAPGRWPGKQGLEFKRVSDRVRFHVPGEFDALTLLTWVRIDALPNRFNSLMMTDGWAEASPHWHIADNGTIALGIRGPNEKRGVNYTTPVVITPTRLGLWLQLAVVYDRDNQLVTHYLNGQKIKEDTLQRDLALHLGDVELGNWNLGGSKHSYPIRYFSGCMDEFLLFDRALSADEIEKLYAEGQPSL